LLRALFRASVGSIGCVVRVKRCSARLVDSRDLGENSEKIDGVPPLKFRA